MNKKETLKEVAERLKDKELFKESNDRARKVLSEIKSLPIVETIHEADETVEEYFLSNIKNMLQFNNDALAIRFMEKYYHAKKEQERSYSEEEVTELLEILQKCKEYFLLKTDKYSDERADAIIDVMEQFKKN